MVHEVPRQGDVGNLVDGPNLGEELSRFFDPGGSKAEKSAEAVRFLELHFGLAVVVRAFQPVCFRTLLKYGDYGAIQCDPRYLRREKPRLLRVMVSTSLERLYKPF
jgi:hypothetical protein